MLCLSTVNGGRPSAVLAAIHSQYAIDGILHLNARVASPVACAYLDCEEGVCVRVYLKLGCSLFGNIKQEISAKGVD